MIYPYDSKKWSYLLVWEMIIPNYSRWQVKSSSCNIGHKGIPCSQLVSNLNLCHLRFPAIKILMSWRLSEYTVHFLLAIQLYSLVFKILSIILWSYLGHFLSPSSKNKNKNPPRKKEFFIFREMELSSSSINKFLIFSYISGNGNSKKILYISRNRNSKSLLIFQKI